jgi:hypothetical protein
MATTNRSNTHPATPHDSRVTRPAPPAQPLNPDAPVDNTRKDPADWKTGDEPMTGAQRSYLTTLSEEAGVPVDEHLTKAQASERIDELRQHNPRAQAADESRAT